MAELETEWRAHDVLGETQEWDDLRDEAAADYRAALDGFLGGGIDVPTFRGRIDSLGKTKGWWGFRGTGQMFFNQLVKTAEPADLADALRAALNAPNSSADAEAKLQTFLQAVDRARERAVAMGGTAPGRGRIDFFVSFFWELFDRDRWPIFYPNSRDILEQHGLLDISLPQPALYTAYNERIQELKGRLGTSTWGVEHLLWRLGKGAPEPVAETAVTSDAPDEGEPEGADLYASYRAQGLYFPDEVVTSLALSLATKRFVILTGISGTGKTKIALGLARHLESVGDGELAEIEPPSADADDAYVRLTAPKLRRGRSTLDAKTRGIIDARLGLPERGTSKIFRARLPDGSIGRLRLNNLGFEDPTRQLWLLFFRKETQEWLNAHAKPGDFLHLDLRDRADVDLALNVVQGTTTDVTTSAQRHVLIAVRSDWTDPRGLIGFFNPLTNSYNRTSVIDLLLRAADDPGHPYIVVLDEMNLARVEYYFSDFLSALESGDPIELMSPGVETEMLALGNDEVPAQLDIPPNVSFIGTVNIDETTHAFSPKVLDRANVIEFSDVDIERVLGHPVEDESGGLRLKDGRLHEAWLTSTHDHALEAAAVAQEVESFTEALEDIHDLLARFHLHFGYRVIAEVSAYVGHALEKTAGEPDEIVRRAFDLQLQQKILPKLSGGRELEEPLARLLAYCLTASKTATIDIDGVRADARRRLDPSVAVELALPPRYPGSTRKLLRMLDRLADTGFVGALE
jgi:energy-coupling factor transporter ATP-binding protein EcfA2